MPSLRDPSRGRRGKGSDSRNRIWGGMSPELQGTMSLLDSGVTKRKHFNLCEVTS
jgi:hypothetical protein